MANLFGEHRSVDMNEVGTLTSSQSTACHLPLLD